MLALRGAVFPRRPGRIDGFTYIGLHRYSVTICTHLRKSIFADRTSIDPVLTTIRQCAGSFGFAIHAYCFMLDHVHLVVAATGEQSDFQRFMSSWKQRAGYQHKQLTGESEAVDRYVFETEDAQTFFAMLVAFVREMLPRYVHEGKAYLNIGIGCTGGKHRSVAVSKRLASVLEDKDWVVTLTHRDCWKGS